MNHEHANHGSHDHGSGGHEHGRGADRRALTIVLSFTTTFMVAEVIGGLLTGSLALLADAGHMSRTRSPWFSRSSLSG